MKKWDFWEFWGLGAGGFAIVAVALQIAEVIRTRDVGGIYAPMFIMFTIGMAMWVTYGVVKRRPAVIVVNTIIGLENLTLLALKLLFSP
jgi:MtN3 and saliva related transmembrane protein